ncbi:MAG: 3-deoxy-D-manno-octulosonic acid kinase [Desulfobacteraceae bacterium Eth-SRB2]|nr:MAG: 3-deoxy-D-manno-octulosonic acid kinase [Desulfobacteraceae bacterium Eth-SRB2]
MSTTHPKTYNSYHFGSPLNIADQQLKQLIRFFNLPKNSVNSPLGGRTSITVTRLQGIGSVVIKYYRRGGVIRYLIKKRYLKCGKTRCQIEYELLQKVRSLGINAPEPVAFAYRGRLFYQCWLVTREIQDHQTLAQLSRSNEEQARMALKAVIKQVSMLIKNKIFHADLHPGNVIVDNQNQVYLLDFDKGGVFPGDKNALKTRYLRRWNRAIQKHGLPEMLSEVNAFKSL